MTALQEKLLAALVDARRRHHALIEERNIASRRITEAKASYQRAVNAENDAETAVFAAREAFEQSFDNG